MSSKKFVLETTFGTYTTLEIIGEGGSGRVFAATDEQGAQVAVKLLHPATSSSEKRRRFKNEIAFLSKTTHPRIVPVLDHGIAIQGAVRSPFYVMPRYRGNLRGLMTRGITPERALVLWAQMLDGVEAAHLKGVVHRDLKPENFLVDDKGDLAVADFGIARFTTDQMATLVDTAPSSRLANFQYAAPEQRVPGKDVDQKADVYALGLMLNELFTQTVPHGTGYRTIGQVAPQYQYLDAIVEACLRQKRSERLESIEHIKRELQRNQLEFISLQRLSTIQNRVVPRDEIDDPLITTPVKLIGVDWRSGTLTLHLSQAVTADWIKSLLHMGSHSAVWGKGPDRFQFHGDRATVAAEEHEVQAVIDHFKEWLPNATRTYERGRREHLRQQERDEAERFRRERESEERRLKVLRDVKI